MNYVLFAVAAYVFMCAFEVIFQEQRQAAWYRAVIRCIGVVVLYTAAAAMLVCYFEHWWLLGFDPQ